MADAHPRLPTIEIDYIAAVPEIVGRGGKVKQAARLARVRVLLHPAGHPIETENPERLEREAAKLLEAAEALRAVQARDGETSTSS